MSPRIAIAVFSLAAVPAGAGLARADAEALRIAWFDPCGLAHGVESVARAEAAALIGRMGANVSWRTAAAGELRRRDEVWVVLVDEGPRPNSDNVVLGATSRRRSVAPLVWIRVPNVRAAVGLGTTRPPGELPPGDRRLFAVALGRVIAHELVHALVPSLPHGGGLMSQTLTRRQLSAATIPIESGVALAFHAALLDDPVFGPSTAALRAAASEAPEEDR